ncbi:hypothetical protein EIP91_003613 [Steccherinum ochraceum]|uniref:Uncharacterized protein n=1 Tax=Steccherinum ochraceum TaxID=92696 RepID=A0A4R0RA80_9APHY|nr:hypothetical protein EIP91_003613 [Steccherinum ochraceum]
MNSGPETVVNSRADLPPPRERKGMRSVSPPLANVSLRRFNYWIALGVAAVLAFYSYRIVQWKAEAGGWWNLALRRKSPMMEQMQGGQPAATPSSAGGKGGGTPMVGGDAEVEQRINELAAALGLPSKDLASAIADAAREYVPPASISSIAAHQTGDAVQYIVDPSGAASSDAQTQVGATATRAMGAVASAFDAALGMDEPPADDLS